MNRPSTEGSGLLFSYISIEFMVQLLPAFVCCPPWGVLFSLSAIYGSYKGHGLFIYFFLHCVTFIALFFYIISLISSMANH